MITGVHIQGCTQNDLSGDYLLAKLVQNCIKCSVSALFMLDGGAKLA